MVGTHYTYKLVHVSTGQFYIGSRTSKHDDLLEDLQRYKSSGVRVKEIGFENFFFGVHDTYNSFDECYWTEQSLIAEYITDPLCLNGCYVKQVPGCRKFSTKGRKFTPEHKQKLSISNLGKKRSAETRKRISKVQKGKPKPWSPEHRQNWHLSRLGHGVTPETRRKISESKKGKPSVPFTPERCLKISLAKMGHSVSVETRRKISNTLRSKNAI